jgi:hypothetical protein
MVMICLSEWEQAKVEHSIYSPVLILHHYKKTARTARAVRAAFHIVCGHWG